MVVWWLMNNLKSSWRKQHGCGIGSHRSWQISMDGPKIKHGMNGWIIQTFRVDIRQKANLVWLWKTSIGLLWLNGCLTVPASLIMIDDRLRHPIVHNDLLCKVTKLHTNSNITAHTTSTNTHNIASLCSWYFQ